MTDFSPLYLACYLISNVKMLVNNSEYTSKAFCHIKIEKKYVMSCRVKVPLKNDS